MFGALGVLFAGSVGEDAYAQMVLTQNANQTTNRPLLHHAEREPQVLSENEVTEIISRILGTSSVVAPEINRRLPSGDLLNRPAANLLLTVDHFQQGMIEAPVMKSMIASNANYKVLIKDASIAAGIPVVLKESASNSLVMCVSASQENIIACEDKGITSWNSASRQFETDSNALMSGDEFVAQLNQQQDGHAVFNLLRSFVANGGKAQYKDGAIELSLGDASARFDMSNEVEMLLFMELHMMATLPERLANDASIMDESPDFFALTVSSLQALSEAYGEGSAQYKLAAAVVDSAVERVVQNFEAIMPNQLVTEVVYTGAHQAVAATARRLLQAGPSPTQAAYMPVTPVEIDLTCIGFTANGEPCPPTLGEIERVQIFFWTMIILIIMLTMSCCCLFNMDLPRDSLLYAKFITEHNKNE